MNRLKRSKLQGTHFESILQLDDTFHNKMDGSFESSYVNDAIQEPNVTNDAVNGQDTGDSSEEDSEYQVALSLYHSIPNECNYSLLHVCCSIMLINKPGSAVILGLSQWETVLHI